jgi:methionine-rich copper-binding protein CopC
MLRRMSTVRFALAAFATATLLSLPTVALAHAELVASDPADGAVVPDPPQVLSATFSEELAEQSQIIVQDASGSEIARGGVSPDDETLMTVELPDLAAGGYAAHWTAVAADDSGVTRGTINFTVGPGASPAPAPTDETDNAETPAELLIVLVAAIALVGALAWFLIRRR